MVLATSTDTNYAASISKAPTAVSFLANIPVIAVPQNKRSIAFSAAAAVSALVISSSGLDRVQATLPVANTQVPFDGAYMVEIKSHMVGAYQELEAFERLESGWDGPDSIAPSRQDVDLAKKFITALPGSIAAPDIGVTSDGFVEMYWRSRVGIVSVSFNGGRMMYYSRIGADRRLGKEVFDGYSVPVDLLRGLEMV